MGDSQFRVTRLVRIGVCGWRSRLRAFNGSGALIQCDMMGSVGTVPQEPQLGWPCHVLWVTLDSELALSWAEPSRWRPSHKAVHSRMIRHSIDGITELSCQDNLKQDDTCIRCYATENVTWLGHRNG